MKKKRKLFASKLIYKTTEDVSYCLLKLCVRSFRQGRRWSYYLPRISTNNRLFQSTRLNKPIEFDFRHVSLI